ncbi:hypothetical protein Tco_1120842 [Tanacetum coccineum]|uniref:Uncharacterized protein n=1 Tax=Tanacetum coccineum TaxID=301880 RepID=A0ABQ5IY89_9ASTR
MCKTKRTLYVAAGLRWWYSDDGGDVGTKVVVDRGGDGRSDGSVVMDGSSGCDDDGGGVGMRCDSRGGGVGGEMKDLSRFVHASLLVGMERGFLSSKGSGGGIRVKEKNGVAPSVTVESRNWVYQEAIFDCLGRP